MRLVKEYLHVDTDYVRDSLLEGNLRGLDGLSLTDVEAEHLISALHEVEVLVDVDTEEIVSVNGRDLLDAPAWAWTLLATVNRLIPGCCVDPSSRVERLVESVHGLLDFIADKGLRAQALREARGWPDRGPGHDVKKAEDFTCPHHRKLADMIGWRQ